MLVASLDGERVDAAFAQRGPEYQCPQCRRVVVLKQGRKVVWHFAHKPPTTCTWAKGETQAHLEAKRLVAEAFAARGYTVQVESVVDTLPGDRRADVLVWSPKGTRLAVELQHTSIGPDEIEARAFAYARAGIAQLWVPFIKPSVWTEGSPRGVGTWFVERYSPSPFERWIHGFNGKDGMWMYDPRDQVFWLGHMAPHRIYVEESSWYGEGGEEQSAGGFHRYSKRWRELTLEGPHPLNAVKPRTKARRAFAQATYRWPEGLVGRLEPG